MVVDEDGKRVVITKNADGSRVVSGRAKGEQRLPVIDINSGELPQLFAGMDAIRVVVAQYRVYLLLASEVMGRRRERMTG